VHESVPVRSVANGCISNELDWLTLVDNAAIMKTTMLSSGLGNPRALK